jgi:predicted MPP superfamily phosphohydrolase
MSITCRAFLRFTAGAATLATGLSGAMVGYAAGFEPNDLVLERKTVKLLKLPNAFDGFRVVLLTDLHLPPFTSANLIRRTVEISNSLKPDLVLLAGDYVRLCRSRL